MLNLATVVIASLCSISLGSFAKAMSLSQDVACYYFKQSRLERRDICKLQDFDTSSVLTWLDGVKTRIRWVSRSSETSTLDRVQAFEYKRDPQSLKIAEQEISKKTVHCLQAIGTANSVCWK
jgi:hypothetical protein